VLEQVYRATIDNAPDLLIVAGDVYDRASPPETAVRQFTDFMQRIVSDTKTAIAIIAGNHDSGDRIGAMGLVADRRRAIIRGPLQSDEVPLLLEDKHGVVAISGLPFGYEYAARECFGNPEIKSPEDVLRAQVKAAATRVPANARWVMIAHAFVAGATSSESERSLSRTVGGIETVPTDVFDGAHYVALGHLHRPQIVGDERITYSGSPLAFSFGEEGHDKSMVLVDLAADGAITKTIIPFSLRRRVRTVKGLLTDVLRDGQLNPSNDFIRVVLTDPARAIDPMKRLWEVYPNACHIDYEHEIQNPRVQAGIARASANADPATIIAEFLKFTREREQTPEEAHLVARELMTLTDTENAA
jgi:exonuclease SbcD